MPEVEDVLIAEREESGVADQEMSMYQGKDKLDKDKCKTKTSPKKTDRQVKVSTSPSPKGVTKQKMKTATNLKVAAISKPVLCQAKSEQSRKQVSSPVGQSVVKTNTATLA